VQFHLHCFLYHSFVFQNKQARLITVYFINDLLSFYYWSFHQTKLINSINFGGFIILAVVIKVKCSCDSHHLFGTVVRQLFADSSGQSIGISKGAFFVGWSRRFS